MQKTAVMILFGGRSAEHEVSIVSSRNILQALDTEKYRPILIGITKDTGKWYHFPDSGLPDSLITLTEDKVNPSNFVNLIQTHQGPTLLNLDSNLQIPIDIALPVLHGRYGEDGSLQGLCRIYNLPFAGPSVAASAVCMDKDFAKRIIESSGIPVVPYITTYATHPISYEEASKKLGPILFVKPANTGSSIGVYKSKSKSDFDRHLARAFQYDNKVIIETSISGREVECAVLGNDHPLASPIGEVKPHHEFYSYDAKYTDPKGADICIPADLPKTISEKIRTYALQAYLATGCVGFSRVDFFLTHDDQIFWNEINTLPGFTNISMYPKLMETSGILYTELLTRILDLAFEEFNRWNKLSTEHTE